MTLGCHEPGYVIEVGQGFPVIGEKYFRTCRASTSAFTVRFVVSHGVFLVMVTDDSNGTSPSSFKSRIWRFRNCKWSIACAAWKTLWRRWEGRNTLSILKKDWTIEVNVTITDRTKTVVKWRIIFHNTFLCLSDLQWRKCRAQFLLGSGKCKENAFFYCFRF